MNIENTGTKQMDSARLGNWGVLSSSKYLFNYYNAIAMSTINFKSNNDNVITEILLDPNQDSKWQLLALLPQIHKCRVGIVDYEPIQCQCLFVPETKDYTENMPYCMQQKLSFTASLMSIRILCSLIDNNHNKELNVSFDDVQTISI